MVAYYYYYYYLLGLLLLLLVISPKCLDVLIILHSDAGESSPYIMWRFLPQWLKCTVYKNTYLLTYDWLRSVVVGTLASINIVNPHWARLLLGWVTASGQVNCLGTMVDVVSYLPIGGFTAQVGRLGPRVGSHLALFCIRRVNRVNSRNGCKS